MKEADDTSDRDLIEAEEKSIDEIRGIIGALTKQAAQQHAQEHADAAAALLDRWADEFRPRLSRSARQELDAGIVALLAAG